MKSHLRPVLRIVLLAAGLSVRLGEPKPLARVHGSTLLRRTLRTLAPCAGGLPVIVVVPPRASRHRLGCKPHDVCFQVNPRRAAGQATSVTAGLARARCASAVLLLPVDLAELATRDVERLVRRWRAARRRVVAQRLSAGAAAPLILPRWLFARALTVTGDRGLRDLVRSVPAAGVALLPLDSAAADVDTPSDLQRARRRARRHGASEPSAPSGSPRRSR